MQKLLLAGLALVGAAFVSAQPRLVAHRGFYTTPGSDENTISSQINAQQLGVYGVEFDVNRTADGELIVVHGPKIGDRLDAQKNTYAEISRFVLPGGNRIPTLREFLNQGRKVPETKLILEIVMLCKKLNMLDQMEFTSFSEHACREFRRLAPKNKTLYISNSLWTPIDADVAKKEGFQLSYSIYVFMNRPELIDRMNEIGVESTLWIVDNPEIVDWAVKHKVDFISSNFPDRTKTYLDALRTAETARNGACNLIR